MDTAPEHTAIARSEAPHRAVSRVLVILIAGLQAIGLAGCAWLSLGWGAFSYPTTQRGEAANVAVNGNWAYVTRGGLGLEVVRADRDAMSKVIMLPPGLESVDDVAVADGLLFALDAQEPGHLGVFSLLDPAMPRPIGAPIAVPVGPFSGVTAAGGRVIVSGGAAPLTLRTYDRAGNLGATAGFAALGGGQPDALLAPGGELAFVPTHDWGPYFQVALIRTRMQPPSMTRVGSVALEALGFTSGGARPASFPIDAAVEGTTLYVASSSGLLLVDVSDAAVPKPIAQLELGVTPVNVDVRDGIAAVVGSDPAPQLVFVDVRNPAQPRILRSYPLPAGSLATGVALTDAYAIVAAHGAGAQLFDRVENAWQQVRRPFPHLVPAPRELG